MKQKMALSFGVLCLLVSGVLSQGFIPPPFRPVPAQRRQLLTPVQQTHILTDIQQHQHRFNLGSFNPQFQKNVNFNSGHQGLNFIQQPSLASQLPSRTQIFHTPPGGLRQSSQTSFQTVNAPPNSIQQHHTQTSFIPNFAQNGQRLTQRTVQNQVHTPNQNFLLPLSPNGQSSGIQEQFPPLTNPPLRFNQPFPNQQFRQQASQAPFVASQPLPVNPFTSINQQVQPFPPPTQQEQSFSITPSIGNQVETVITETRFNQPTNTFISQASLQNQPQFSSQSQNQPQFAAQTAFNDQFEREKQRLIQKHEQFQAKQYQKELAKAEELHKEFLKKQASIKNKHQELKQQAQGSFPSNQGRLVLPSETTFFEQALKQYELEHPTTTTTTTQAPTTKPKATKSKQKEILIENPNDLTTLLQTQKDKIYSLLKQDGDVSVSKSKNKVKSTKALSKDDLLKQLKLALANQPQDLGDKNVTTMDVVLPTGEKVQVIRTSDPDFIRRAGVDPSQVITENAPASPDLTASPINLDEIRKNLPPGTDFELVRRTADGREEVVKVPPKKKVTFVYLEEQKDGSYKVQGVKTDKDKEAKTSGVEVDSILKRIKAGEIKLPPPSADIPEEPIPETPRPPTTTAATAAPHTISRSTFFSTVTLPAFSTPRPTFETPRTHFFTSRTTTPPATTTDFAPEVAESIYEPAPSETSEVSTSLNELSNILRNNGLHAMAKYLKQSGLDSILNETGPYTVFAPTDKAFKSLLVQLGGPDKAEEKFRNNPRLLSGLLLHHVIPGSFEISALQDEMTGVSLAGTQLRVNQYTMQDSEWNDLTITTINGAMTVADKQDITIPQGVAHGIDRVMFPLPVGDILQTLQSDRERKYTQFLRALFTSGMSDTLQNKGVKTYTVFAPTDAAFNAMPAEEVTKIGSEKEAAEAFVKKHVVPGTLFTAGMRFYQVKESMADGKSVTLQKNGGKIRVNDSTMLASNIPATNGVIHSIDNLL